MIASVSISVAMIVVGDAVDHDLTIVVDLGLARRYVVGAVTSESQ